MKTKVIVAVFAIMAAMASFANEFQYLYWMVDISDQSDEHPEYQFKYATVSANGTTFKLYDYDGQPTESTKFGADAGGFSAGKDSESAEWNTPQYAGDVSEAYALGSTFLFELFNDDNEKVAWKSVSSSALSSYIGSTMSQTSYFTLTGVVPEPTSGLLMLLGLAGLALKRKRA